MILENDKLKEEILSIKIELVEGKGIPVEMFGDLLIAHQEILQVIVKSEDKDATAPSLRVVDVQHGSLIIKSTLDVAQQYMPFVKPLLEKMGNFVQNALSGTQTITVTKKQEIKISNKILEKMSAPMVEGLVKRVTAFEDDHQDMPLYSISSENLKGYIEQDSNELDLPARCPSELGIEQEIEGQLKEIDWDNSRAKFSTQIDGKKRKIPCIILDSEFMYAPVTGNMFAKLTVIPEFSIGSMGERTLKLFRVQKVEILGQ